MTTTHTIHCDHVGCSNSIPTTSVMPPDFHRLEASTLGEIDLCADCYTLLVAWLQQGASDPVPQPEMPPEGFEPVGFKPPPDEPSLKAATAAQAAVAAELQTLRAAVRAADLALAKEATDTTLAAFVDAQDKLFAAERRLGVGRSA